MRARPHLLASGLLLTAILATAEAAPISASMNITAQISADLGSQTVPFSTAWGTLLSDLSFRAMASAGASCGEGSVSVRGNGLAEWVDGNSGSVALTGYGWNLCASENAATGTAASLNSDAKPDWRYKFSADGPGVFSMDYDVEAFGADPDGLNGFSIFWNAESGFVVGLGDEGTFVRNLAAGGEYEVSIRNNAAISLPPNAPAASKVGSMDGLFAWTITTADPPPGVPEPGSLALLGAALAAIAFARRRTLRPR